MRTEVLIVAPDALDASAIARAADVLRRGGLVAFPTETVYGLGAHALDAAAVERIFAAKGRPPTNPIIVHVADADAARSLVSEWSPPAQALAARFWPGPLTLVLRRTAAVPDLVTAGGATVAVRAPAHPVAQALLRAADVPIAAPSANRSTRLSPTRAEHVLRDLDGRIDLLLDAGATPGGIESTVLDLTVRPPRLLRPGPVTPAQIEAIIGPIQVSGGVEHPPAGPPRSPGMQARHYAPRAALDVIEPGVDPAARVAALRAAGQRVGLLTFGEGLSSDGPDVLWRQMPTSPIAYAARLYDALHDLDDAGVDRILVRLPPDTPEWMAVRDRLRRGASG